MSEKSSLIFKNMIHKNTLKFLQDLMLDNSKDWFDEHRKDYEFAKSDLLMLTEKLIAKVSEFDENIANARLDVKKCITRINRDLRFSKDRTPYKTDFYIVLNKDGKNGAAAFYYLHIEPDNSFVGGGVYNPQPEQLKLIRKGIEANFDEWNETINNPQFKQTFPSGIHTSGVLSKVPKGFSQNSLAIEFLKMKGYFTMENLSDKEIVSSEVFEKIINRFKASKPLVDFINKTLETN